ncbi:hypothetical protein AAVH_11818 [Aphelenchoides avenae]|nr:hypothetical protein AAVH_11818 [Aphelenchus avenae]
MEFHFAGSTSHIGGQEVCQSKRLCRGNCKAVSRLSRRLLHHRTLQQELLYREGERMDSADYYDYDVYDDHSYDHRP